MSILVPVIVIGALASAAWALDKSAPAALHAITALSTPSIQPLDENGDPHGLGAYLKGAVADIGGAPDTALQGYLQALGDDPDNLDLRARAFELALMSGDVDSAIRLAHTLPDLNQTTISRLVLMADAAHEGRIPEARKSAREVAKISPDLLQFRLLQAYLDYARGTKVDKLIRQLDATPLPGSLAGRQLYHEARLLLKDGQPQKALNYLRKAHQAEPSAVTSTLLLGQLLARQGQPDEGAAIYDTFRAANPALSLLIPPGSTLLTTQPEPFASTVDDDLSATLADFGLLVWAQGAIGPARQILNLALWLNPDDAYTRYYQALLLEMGQDFPAARAEYTNLLDKNLHPDFKLAVQIRLGEVEYRLGNKDAAYTAMRKLARQNPQVIPLQRSASQMAFDKGEFMEAAEGYSRILENLTPETPTDARVELLFARGASLERAGKVKEASDDLLAALKLAPTNASIMNYLGYMWVDNGMRIPEAFTLLQKAHLLAPRDGAITDSLGWAYFKQGDAQTAASYLVIATEQSPESPEIYDHLGDAYAKLGKQVEARREWQRALDLITAGKEVPSPDFVAKVQKKLR